MARSTNRNALAFALVVGCCSLAGVLNAQNAAPAPASQTNTQNSAQSNSFQASLLGLVGEWQGTCEVTWAPGDTTSTDLNVSVKANNVGGVLFAYDSFARGKAIAGLTNWVVANNQLLCSTYDQRTEWQCNFGGALPASNQGTFAASVNGVNFTQNINFRADGSVVIEYFKANGNTQELQYRFTMTRMASDKLSSASAYLDDAKLLAKVNVANATTTAGVTTNE